MDLSVQDLVLLEVDGDHGAPLDRGQLVHGRTGGAEKNVRTQRGRDGHRDLGILMRHGPHGLRVPRPLAATVTFTTTTTTSGGGTSVVTGSSFDVKVAEGTVTSTASSTGSSSGSSGSSAGRSQRTVSWTLVLGAFVFSVVGVAFFL